MVKAVGIDSGTKTMDIYGFDDQDCSVLVDFALSREEVTKDPSLIIDKLKEIQHVCGKIDAIAGPAGYGLPLQRAKDATLEDIALATFITQADVERKLKIVGLRQLMQLMKNTPELNIWFTPGVIQLPTVPEYRKANRVDMGTNDKVPSTILAVKNQAERLKIRYDQTNLIVVEIGFAYTSAMAVKKGQIVDAMAGTAGFPSFLGMGFLDGELAYALANTAKDFSKLTLFAGGAAAVARLDTSKPIEEFLQSAKANENVKSGLDLMVESVVKDVASLLPSVKPKEIILSGRFSKIPEFYALLEEKLSTFFSEIGSKIDVVKIEGNAKIAKGAAEGAAIFANGIAHGKFEPIIDVMKLRESKGGIFDHVYLDENIKKGLEAFKKY
ncbi:MAG TPA: DUF1464 family protein [Candidatus Acidoferrales bacterium]|nr:DUF1464 family protein [Candidatus Acidoferrales bacterium]